MQNMVGSWQSPNFRAARRQAAGRAPEDLGQSLTLASEQTVSRAPAWVRIQPRMTRIVDVLIASTVAYFFM